MMSIINKVHFLLFYTIAIEIKIFLYDFSRISQKGEMTMDLVHEFITAIIMELLKEFLTMLLKALLKKLWKKLKSNFKNKKSNISLIVMKYILDDLQ